MTASTPFFTQHPDADLVRRLKAGGPGAGRCFDLLMARHGVRLRRRAARILGDESEAEDIVQEVFTKVHRFLDRYVPERPLRHWLSIVTLNACRIELRRRAARLRRHDAFEADPLRTTESSIAGDPLLRGTLATAFSALDPRTRDCIVLRVIDGLSYQEIGQRCGQSEAAVKMRVLRGLRELRVRHPQLAGETESGRSCPARSASTARLVSGTDRA